MSRLKSRLDKLDGGWHQDTGPVIAYIPIEDVLEWPDEVGDFIISRMGVFYRHADETPESFVQRVKDANWPPRSLDEMSDAELEHSLESIHALTRKMHPEYRQSALEAMGVQP
ncbi:MAG: hypothetical protein AAGA74_20455 [Pseudomonadota bacterium]